MKHCEKMILWTRVAACVIVFFAEGFQMSLNGPFYPEQAHKKGLDQTKTGLATGTQYVARVFSSILVLAMGSAENQNFIFIASAFCAGLMSCAFALLVFVPGVWPFFTLSILARLGIGIFSAGAWGTGFSVITSFYPSNEGLIVGLIETAYGAGQMLGPIMGNVLFSWRGFSTPFNVAGCFEAFLAIICILAIPGRIVSSSRKKVDPTGAVSSYKMVDKKKGKVGVSVLWHVFKPNVVLAALPLITVYSTVGFTSVALGPYLLDAYGYDSESNGEFFFAAFATATVASLVFGYLIDLGFCGKIYLLSLLTGSVGYFLLFLPQLYPPARHLMVLYTALILIGLSVPASYTGSFLIGEKAASKQGSVDETEVRLYVLSTVSFWLSIGISIGQMVTGGFIYSKTNFNYACLSQFIMISVSAIPSAVWMHRNNLIGQIYYHSPEDLPEMTSFVPNADGPMKGIRTTSCSVSINGLASSGIKYR